MNYKVTWSIDIFDADSPKEAALKAWETYFQHGPDRIANVFAVKEENADAMSPSIMVDLQEEFDLEKEASTNETYKRIGQYLSADERDYDEIVRSLKLALKEDPKNLIDYIEYTLSDGINTDLIPVWEKVQMQFTVEEFCDLVGIE